MLLAARAQRRYLRLACQLTRASHRMGVIAAHEQAPDGTRDVAKAP